MDDVVSQSPPVGILVKDKTVVSQELVSPADGKSVS